MATDPSEVWSPPEGASGTLSPSRLSYDSQRLSSDGDDSATHTRRLNISPSPSQYNDDVDDAYDEGNSIDEVEATLNSFRDDYGDTERSHSPWSPGSYSSGPTFSSATGTFTYTGSYRGSPSFVSLPTFSPRSPLDNSFDPRVRLSRITERTEESRPASTVFSGASRPVATPDNAHRSVFMGAGTTSFHSRSSTEPGSDRTLPVPGRLEELIAVFEPLSSNASHSRAASTPARSSSPMAGTSRPTSSYMATSYGYSSRPSSPSKLRVESSASHRLDSDPSLLSPPVRPSASGFRTPFGVRSDTPSYTTPSYTTASYTATPSAFSNTTQTGSYTTPNTDVKTITGSEDTFTRSTITPASTLRKPESPPRSPLATVRNIVALWKERTPASVRTGGSSASPASPVTPSTISHDERYGIHRRVDGARAQLRAGVVATHSRPVSQEVQDSANASVNSGRSGVFPPGFDLSEFSTYARSNDPPTHIGLLWYLNVHASPPYRWQRCQALLYPHALLLSWLAPGGGRGIVALDLLNCTSVQSAPSPTHPIARDDVGTIAARQQSNEPNSQPLMEMLVPFHMMYADGVERLAAESVNESQKWINRIWEAVNRPINVPDSVSVTRSPTGSIRTILTIESDASHSSNGSRSTVFVPPLSSIPDISDLPSSPGLSRRSSVLSSHHSHTVDDMVIRNQDSDQRSITSSGSTIDLDDEFRKARSRIRGPGGFFGSPVTVTSGSSLGKAILIPPPPSGGRISSDEDRFLSASSDGLRSNVSSTYFSPTASVSGSRTLTEFTPATSATQVPPSSTFASTFLASDSASELSFVQPPSTLSRARVIRRRVASAAQSTSSGYQTEVSRSSSDKENEGSVSEDRTPTDRSGSYTPGSGTLSLNGGSSDASGSYLDSRSRTPTGSYAGSYSGSEGSRSRGGDYSGSASYSGSGSYLPSGGYTPGNGSYTLQAESNIIESSSSGAPDHTPISSSETGYDICPSSDLTDMTRTTTVTTTVTPARSPVLPVPVPDLPAETYVTASLASTEYETVPVLSPRASVTSFGSLPTIPSEYWSAPSISSYRTASEPQKSPPPSVYDTAGEIESIPEIPSVTSTPKLSSIGIPELDMGSIRVPSVIPTIRSPESLISDLEAADIPLPSSLPRSPTPLPSIEVPQVSQPLPSISRPLPTFPPQPIQRPFPTLLPQPIQPLPAFPPPPVQQPLPPLPPQPLQPLAALPQPIQEPIPSEPQSSASTPTPVTALSTPRARVEEALPPLPPSLPSQSPSLSPTPSPLSPSTLERDVATPTSIHLPPVMVESLVTDDLSLLSSLPPSTFESSSVITPTTLAIVSSPAVSSHAPSPRPVVTRVPSSSLSISSVTLSTFTESSSPIPPSPHAWATATDISYESSILRPSPSVRSVMLPEGMEVSFETSILRPTGSPSSVGRISTIPPSPSLISPTAHSPLPPLTPVPALPPSLPSATDIETPTTLDFTTESSSISVSQVSISRTPSISSSSYSTESSLTPSTIDFEDEEPPVEFPLPSTEPSLLSTVHPPSEHPSVPSLPRAASLPTTPEGTLIVSITTPQGSGATEQSSLRTIPSSVSAVTQRDLGQDFDRLADEVRTYDQARGLEHQDLADNVRALRDELQGLADYLRRTPSPVTPVTPVPVHRIPPPRVVPSVVAPEMLSRIQLVDQPAGDSVDLSPIFPGVVEVVVPAPASSLLRSTSNASSIQSYLSSHHSDDDILEEDMETPLPSPAVWGAPASETTAGVTSSSSISSSPVTPSSEMESEVTTTMREAPDALERALRGIQDQLNALEDGQNNARNMLEALQRQPEDHMPELAERLQRIENLIQTLLDQGHPQGPEIPGIRYRPPSPSRTASISASTDSLRRLRSILRDLASPADAEPRHMPIPTVPPGPSIAQQLDDILSAAQVPPTTAAELPRIQPFVYRPADRGARARSISPVSMEIPPRSHTVPLVFPVPVRPIRPAMRPPRERSELDLPRDTTAEPRAPEQVYRDVRRPEEQEGFRVGPGPTPQPVFHDRPLTAPPDIGAQGPGAPPTSWYRQKPSTSTAPAPVGAEPGGVRYMPMPAGPTVVQLPPLFDSLMEILRENRLAQLATVDQQRELMRYMRGLNAWLERDVRDRHNEMRNVYELVEQLGRDFRDMQMRARRPSTPTSSDESETAIRYNFPAGPPPPFPGPPPHGFQPFPLDHAPVMPPVVPDQPTIILQQPGQVIPGGIPPIRRPDYHPAGPGPLPPTRVPTEDVVPFIPAPSRASTGTPLPTLPVPMSTPMPTYPSSMGPNVVPYPESPPSSESPSTPSRRPRRRRRDSSPSYDSRTPTSSIRRDSRPPLAVTNGPEAGFQPGPILQVVSPSVSPSPSMMPGQPGQPTVILQQPPQHLTPSVIPYPQPQLTDFRAPSMAIPISDYSAPPSPVFPAGGVPMAGPVMPPPIAAIPTAVTPQPYPVTPIVQPYPMTSVPTIAQPFPVTTVPTMAQPYPVGPPVLMPHGSPRSTPSPRRRHTPPPAPVQAQPQQPIIIDTSRRSHSPPPIATYPTGVPMMGAPMMGAPMMGAPIMGTAPIIMPHGSPTRHSRSPDRPPVIMQQPTVQPMYPPPVSTAPQPVLAPGMLPYGPPVMMPSRYSRSPSPRPHHAAPPVILQQEPGRRRSYSYSPRRRSYSPRLRRRSPLYERDRSYDRDPYDRERPYGRDRRYGRRPYSPMRDESYSPTPPRRRRPRSSDVSRTPPSGYYAPTVPYAPTGAPAPSHYFPRHSPPYVEVVDIPQRPRRRERSLSPVLRRRSPEYERSPRDYRGRHPRRRASISPSYSRSQSPYRSPSRRTRPLERTADAPGPRGEEERDTGMPPRRATPRSSSLTPTSFPPRRTTPRSSSPTPTSIPPRGTPGISRTASPTPISPRATPGTIPTHSPPPISRRATPGTIPTHSPIFSPPPEEVTRPPIMVTVPAPTSRPPRETAEVGPQIFKPTFSVPPTFPSERAESEEPLTPPRRPEVEELAEVHPIAEPSAVAERVPAVPTRRPTTTVGYPPIEDPREQIEALNRAADRLQMTVASAEEAEDRREHEYRQHEDERMQIFLDHEAQRNEEARQRADAIWHDLEERLATLPPVPLTPLPTVPLVPAAAEQESEPEEERAEIESIASVPQQVAPQVADIREMIESVKDELAKEHERMADERTAFFDELREEKDREIEERNNRIHALEAEVQQLRAEIEAERQHYLTEADRREQERQEHLAETNDMRTQIHELTSIVQESKASSEEKYREKVARRLDKDADMVELKDMVQKIHDDMVNKARVDDLERQNAELHELLRSLSDSWREDCQRHHEETLEAVRSNADKQVPFNVQGYLDEFSQALAAEVRMLLGEVGKIREERRGLQHEIGDLLSVRSKYGPGGEYEPDWRPPGPPPPPPEAMGPGGPPGGPDEPPPGGIPPPRPAWRTVYQKPSKKKKKEAGPSTAAAAPRPSVPMHPQHLMPPTHGYGDVRQQLARSWDTWHPDRTAVTPPSVEPTLAVPGRQSPGLFGPRTPSTNSNSMYERR